MKQNRPQHLLIEVPCRISWNDLATEVQTRLTQVGHDCAALHCFTVTSAADIGGRTHYSLFLVWCDQQAAQVEAGKLA